MVQSIEEERRQDRCEPDYEAECAAFNCASLIHDPDRKRCKQHRSLGPIPETTSPTEFGEAVINAIVQYDETTGDLIRGPQTVPIITNRVDSERDDGSDSIESHVISTLLTMELYGLTRVQERPGGDSREWTYTGPEAYVTRGNGQ